MQLEFSPLIQLPWAGPRQELPPLSGALGAQG